MVALSSGADLYFIPERDLSEGYGLEESLRGFFNAAQIGFKTENYSLQEANGLVLAKRKGMEMGYVFFLRNKEREDIMQRKLDEIRIKLEVEGYDTLPVEVFGSEFRGISFSARMRRVA